MWQIGKTKVFMREEEYTCIEELRKQHRGIAATIIQKNYRRHVARTKYVVLLAVVREVLGAVLHSYYIALFPQVLDFEAKERFATVVLSVVFVCD